MHPRFFFLIGKDVNRPIGGVMQIYRLANTLATLGYDTTIIQGSDDFLPDWFDISSLFKRISLARYKNLQFSVKSDYLVIPETYIPHYFSLPGIKKVIFNQNAGYTFGENLNISPKHVRSVYSDPLLAAVICVSLADYEFLHTCMHVSKERLFRLNNPIDISLFTPHFPKEPIILYMTRKQRSHSRILLSLIESLDSYKSGSWQTIGIEKCSLNQVSVHMKQSFLFLSFGFPEGFGLPLAESLACGCRLVGYDGVGGKEIFSAASAFNCAKSVPIFDFATYVSCVDSYLRLYNESKSISSFYEPSHLVSSSIRTAYSSESFLRTCKYFCHCLAS